MKKTIIVKSGDGKNLVDIECCDLPLIGSILTKFFANTLAITLEVVSSTENEIELLMEDYYSEMPSWKISAIRDFIYDRE